MNSSVLRPSLVRSVTILALFVGFADLGGCRVEDELSGNGTGGAGNAGAGNAQAGAQNAAGAKSEQRRTDEKELSRLREEILALVDETSACVEDDDCAALPLGKKPCGGAWEYLGYSTTSPKEGDLVTLANNLEKAEDEFNRAYGVESDCSYVVEPEVGCEETVCVVVAED